MNSDPLITIYITCYNYERFVKKAIDSVLSQSFSHYELIIIDDGSTDRSADVIREYEGLPKVRIILQENKGLNVTNNIAARAARGRYIMRLDADDFLDENALLVMGEFIQKNPDVDMVFPDYFLVDAYDKVFGVERRQDFETEVALFDRPAHGACTLIKLQALHEVKGYYDMFGCQDGYDLWLKFIKRYKISNINLPLFYYRQHTQSLTKNEVRLFRTRAHIQQKFIEDNLTDKKETVAVLPIRGPQVDARDMAFLKVGEKFLIDLALASVLKANRIKDVILISEDDRILEYVNIQYHGKVKIYRRNIDQARENVSFKNSINSALDFFYKGQGLSLPDYVLIRTLETPFLSSVYVDHAIDSMRIFEVDSVIPVVLENSFIYTHNGRSLVSCTSEESSLRLEKSQMYRKIAGLQAYTYAALTRKTKSDKQILSHIVLDQIAATEISTHVDLVLANLIFSGIKAGQLSTVTALPDSPQSKLPLKLVSEVVISP